jgi:hypothetical protein
MTTASHKDDSAKARYDLIPPHALDALVRILTFGARKYAANNWRHVDGRRARYFAAAMRHMWAWWRATDLTEARDRETGESHLAHAVCCIMFLLDEEEHAADLTDRR